MEYDEIQFARLNYDDSQSSQLSYPDQSILSRSFQIFISVQFFSFQSLYHLFTFEDPSPMHSLESQKCKNAKMTLIITQTFRAIETIETIEKCESSVNKHSFEQSMWVNAKQTLIPKIRHEPFELPIIPPGLVAQVGSSQ
jgi:hypothetical protein